MKRIVPSLIVLFLLPALLPGLQAQWVRQNSGTTQTLTDVVMLDSVTAVVSGRNRSILRTTNSGTRWTDITAPMSSTAPWNSLSFYDTLNGVAVGDDGVVFTTSNGGTSWFWHRISGGQNCLSAIHISPARIYVGADSGWIYYTADTGRTWSAQKISAWPIRSLFRWRGVTAGGFDQRYALTPLSLLTETTVLPGPPVGWQETNLPNFQGLGSQAAAGEFCLGGGPGFIVGVQGDLRASPAILRKKTTDTAWTQISSGTTHDGAFLGVSAPSETTVYVCGTGGMVLKSTNAGDSWSAAPIATSQTLHAVYFNNDHRGFAVGDSGTVFFTSNGGMTGVSRPGNSLPEEFVLEQNYPNPFNPSTTISFRLPIGAFVTVKIYDGLGRECVTLLAQDFPPGIHRTEWNAGVFRSGIYFCRLNAGLFTAVKRLALLK